MGSISSQVIEITVRQSLNKYYDQKLKRIMHGFTFPQVLIFSIPYLIYTSNEYLSDLLLNDYTNLFPYNYVSIYIWKHYKQFYHYIWKIIWNTRSNHKIKLHIFLQAQKLKDFRTTTCSSIVWTIYTSYSILLDSIWFETI